MPEDQELEEDITDIDIESDETEEDTDENNEDSPQVLVISDSGMGKRSYINKYRMTKRAAKGVVSIKLNSDEKVISAIQVVKGDEILITTRNGQTVRIPTDEIRTIGRASKGVRIMDLRGKNDVIASIAKLVDVKFDKDNEDSQDGEESEQISTNNTEIEEEATQQDSVQE